MLWSIYSEASSCKDKLMNEWNTLITSLDFQKLKPVNTEETVIKSDVFWALVEILYLLCSSVPLSGLTPPPKARVGLKPLAEVRDVNKESQTKLKELILLLFPSFLLFSLSAVWGTSFSPGQSLCSAACLQIHAALYNGSLLGLIPPCWRANVHSKAFKWL